jgi:hypothetical protein
MRFAEPIAAKFMASQGVGRLSFRSTLAVAVIARLDRAIQ